MSTRSGARTVHRASPMAGSPTVPLTRTTKSYSPAVRALRCATPPAQGTGRWFSSQVNDVTNVPVTENRTVADVAAESGGADVMLTAIGIGTVTHVAVADAVPPAPVAVTVTVCMPQTSPLRATVPFAQATGARSSVHVTVAAPVVAYVTVAEVDVDVGGVDRMVTVGDAGAGGARTDQDTVAVASPPRLCAVMRRM